MGVGVAVGSGLGVGVGVEVGVATKDVDPTEGGANEYEGEDAFWVAQELASAATSIDKAKIN